jgi:hypothetical protein
MEETMTREVLGWIERKKPTLVGWAEAYLDKNQIYKPKPSRERGNHGEPAKQSTPVVSGSQLRNLLSAAQAGSSLAVLVNFLRYQIGRKDKGWPDRGSGEALEKLLREDLKGLAAQAEKVRADDDHFEVEPHLAAQLLGFIIREYTYRCAVAGTRP